VKVDDRISDSEAACLQSLSDSVAAVETAQLRMGDAVVILGQGSMGLECLQVVRLSARAWSSPWTCARRRVRCPANSEPTTP